MKLTKLTLYVFGLNDKQDYDKYNILEDINVHDDLCMACFDAETVDAGEYNDEHPLNSDYNKKGDFEKYFEVQK